MALPLVGGKSVANIESVVVLPAPFGPNSPKISPSFIAKEILSTAVKSSNFFVKFFISISDMAL